MKKYIAKQLLDNSPLNGSIIIDKHEYDEYYINRRIGRSTAQAFKYIAEAIDNPNTSIKIIDHHEIERGTKKASQYLFDSICRLIDNNNLKYFKLNRHSLTIRYEGVIDLDDMEKTVVTIYRPRR